MLLFVAACGESSAATVVEVPPAALPPPPPPAQATLAQPRVAPEPPACSAPSDLGDCREVARVRVSGISLSSSTCFVDLRVATGDVGRVMRCPSGAVVVFDKIRYGGTLDGNVLDACVTTSFPFNDGCTWRSMQRVRGVLGATVGLSLSYAEAPVSGTGCAASSCSALANLEWVRP